MSYSQGHKTGVDREVIKWLQDLELSFHPRNLRRDLSNGYLVAEIFSRYYPHDISVYSYHNGVSFSSKQKNWSRIQKFLKKKNLELSKEVIYGSIHCEPGAAEQLVQDIYEMLTNQNVTDVQGQQSQPSSLTHSTSSRSFGNNLVAAGIMAESDVSSNQRRAQISRGERELEHTAADRSLPTDSSTWRGAPVSYKEIKVNQPVRNSMVNLLHSLHHSLSPLFKIDHSNTEDKKKKKKSPKEPESG
ncbi:spermatogenesis-associated protein 4 isoform X1 [Xiphophorus maculatus]|uniref:Spermatogenesis-associated protein 4 n=1 Tax=Xiphophorus maculatus TaxID=8083 RepID=M3ZJ88_XIPMA|nr:spermatogenesis-associated protein 4 isoform X1 [Xiphophorus maculatus]